MEEIVIPILTAIIGALIGVLGTFLTTKYKLKNEEKKERELERKNMLENKPDFEIVNFCDFDYFNDLPDKTADIEVFVSKIQSVDTGSRFRAIYDKDDLLRENWVTQRYEFKNTGKTEVMHLYVASNIKRTTCLFGVNSVNAYINNDLLSYSEILEKRIKPVETFTLNISFHKDRIIDGVFSAAYSLGLCDKNNNYWEQPLFAPHSLLYTSQPISFTQFKDMIDFQAAMDCFHEPYLW